MAVSSFQYGKTYRVSGNDLSSIVAYDELHCSVLKLKFYSAPTITAIFKGDVVLMQNGSGTWFVYDDYGNFVMSTSDNDYAYALTEIEFVASVQTNANTDASWKTNAILVNDAFAQVSIYNEYSSTWVDLPCASEYTGIATTVVDSGRNPDGVVIADVIASDIAKVEMKWNFLTLEQYSLIAQLFEPKYHGEFMNAVRFFDVVKGDFDGDNSSAPDKTNNPCRIMYCGDRKVSFAKIKLDDDGKPIGYQGVSLNLIDTHKIYGE